MAVVKLHHVARRRGACHHGSAALAHEDRGTHRLAADVFEHDVRVIADERADLFAEAAPLTIVLGVFVLPESVALRLAVDDRLDAEFVEQRRLLRRADDADRYAAAVEHVLSRVAADAPGGPPHQHRVSLLHPRSVLADEHPVARAVAQRVDARLFPCEMCRLGHQLIGLDDGEIGQATEVGLEAPDPLVRAEHRIIVGGRVLIVDVVAVHGHPVPGFPVSDCRAGAEHDTGSVGTNDLIRKCMAAAPLALLAETIEEAERRQRFEDAGPHRVEVDRARHHCDDGFVRRNCGKRHFADVQALARVLVGRRDAFEHRRVFAADEHCPIRLGQRQARNLFATRLSLDRFENLVHQTMLPMGRKWPATRDP